MDLLSRRSVISHCPVICGGRNAVCCLEFRQRHKRKRCYRALHAGLDDLGGGMPVGSVFLAGPALENDP